MPERIGSNWSRKTVILLSLAQGGGRSLSTVTLNKINPRLCTRVTTEFRAWEHRVGRWWTPCFWRGRADPMSTKGRKSKLTFTVRLTLASKWTSWTESQLWKAYKKSKNGYRPRKAITQQGVQEVTWHGLAICFHVLRSAIWSWSYQGNTSFSHII